MAKGNVIIRINLSIQCIELEAQEVNRYDSIDTESRMSIELMC